MQLKKPKKLSLSDHQRDRALCNIILKQDPGPSRVGPEPLWVTDITTVT